MDGRRIAWRFHLHVAAFAILAAVPVWFAANALTLVAVRSAAMPAGLFLALHVFARRYPLLTSGEAPELRTATFFGYAVLLTAPLPVAVIGLALAAAVPDRLQPGARDAHRMARLVLEVARAALLFSIAGGVLHALVPAELLHATTTPTAVTLLALIPTGLAAYLVDLAVTALVTAAEQDTPLRTVLRQDRGAFDLPGHLLLVGLAPVAVVVAEHSLLLLPLLLLAVLAHYRSSQAAAERQHESLHDDLTGLPNRRLLDVRLAELIEPALLEDRFALLLMDLDRFKEVNDGLGHHMGDQLLAQVGARLRTLDGIDIAARLGGDEFAFVVRGIDDSTDLLAVGERLVAEVSRPYVVQDIRLSIGASVGIATFPDHGLDASSVLRRADSAMYSAKRSGVPVGMATVRSEARLPGRVSLLGELEGALTRGELKLDYQPQASLRTGEIVGVESLLRWHHPEHGLVPPSAFVDTVEHTELIAPLTRWVIDRALADVARWAAAGVTVPVALNISARDLQDHRFPRDLAGRLAEHGVLPGQLTLEITENALLGDPERAGGVLSELTELGVNLSIDDFGTGYSSLAALRRLPVHEVKIDRSFVHGMEEDAAGAAIVRSIVHLAHALGLRVVAEGVEHESTLWELERYGCDVVQGYLVSRPLPPQLVAPWVRARRQELVAARDEHRVTPAARSEDEADPEREGTAGIEPVPDTPARVLTRG